MSNLETPAPQEPDKDKYLTQPEREQLQRLLSQPEEFPRELGSWITDYVGTNAFLQKSQVQGLPLLNTQVAQALETLETTVEALAVIGTTYTDTPGTTIQTTGNGDTDISDPDVSVPAGTYFCFLAANSYWAAGDVSGAMRLYDASTATAFGSTAITPPFLGSGQGPLLSFGSVTVTGETNSIKGWFQQYGNGAINFSNLTVTALRTA